MRGVVSRPLPECITSAIWGSVWVMRESEGRERESVCAGGGADGQGELDSPVGLPCAFACSRLRLCAVVKVQTEVRLAHSRTSLSPLTSISSCSRSA